MRLGLIAIAAALLCLPRSASSQEVTLEEIRVEGTFDLKLEPPPESAVRIMIERLTLRSEAQRALELQVANRTPLSTLLELTKYIPIPMGSSENRIDTFFFDNATRPDLYRPPRNRLFDDH